MWVDCAQVADSQQLLLRGPPHRGGGPQDPRILHRRKLLHRIVRAPHEPPTFAFIPFNLLAHALADSNALDAHLFAAVNLGSTEILLWLACSYNVPGQKYNKPYFQAHVSPFLAPLHLLYLLAKQQRPSGYTVALSRNPMCSLTTERASGRFYVPLGAGKSAAHTYVREG